MTDGSTPRIHVRQPQARFRQSLTGAAVTFTGAARKARWRDRAAIREGTHEGRQTSRQAAKEKAARLVYAFVSTDADPYDTVPLQALMELSLDNLALDSLRLAAIALFLEAVFRPAITHGQRAAVETMA